MHTRSTLTNIKRITTVIERTIIDNIIENKLIALSVSVFAEGV